jgi:shikimate kinase
MVIVITGPIASGKSTVARELARELEAPGVRVEVIDLDLVHDQLATGSGQASDEPTWRLARRLTALAVNAFVDEGVAVVIAEGSFNLPSDRAALAQQLRPSRGPFYVTLQVSFAEALRRAQGDPTRGRSRDPGFLRSHFAERQHVLAAAPSSDLVIDTEQVTAAAVAAMIARRVQPSGA